MGLRIVTDCSRLSKNEFIAVGVARCKALMAQIKGAFVRYVTSRPGGLIRITSDGAGNATIFIKELCWRRVASYPLQTSGSIAAKAFTAKELVAWSTLEILIADRDEKGKLAADASYQWGGAAVTRPVIHYDAAGNVAAVTYGRYTSRYELVTAYRDGEGVWTDNIDFFSGTNYVMTRDGIARQNLSLWKSTPTGWTALFAGTDPGHTSVYLSDNSAMEYQFNDTNVAGTITCSTTLIHSGGGIYGPAVVTGIDSATVLSGIGYLIADLVDVDDLPYRNLRIVCPKSNGTWGEAVSAGETRHTLAYGSNYLTLTGAYTVIEISSSFGTSQRLIYGSIDYFTVHEGQKHLAVSIPTTVTTDTFGYPIVSDIVLHNGSMLVRGQYFGACTSTYFGVFKRGTDGMPTTVYSVTLAPMATAASAYSFGDNGGVYGVSQYYRLPGPEYYSVAGPSHVIATHPGGATDLTDTFGGGHMVLAGVVAIGADFGAVAVYKGYPTEITTHHAPSYQEHYLLRRTATGWIVMDSVTYPPDQSDFPSAGSSGGDMSVGGASFLYDSDRFGLSGLVTVLHSDYSTSQFASEQYPTPLLLGGKYVLLKVVGGAISFYDTVTRTTFGGWTVEEAFDAVSSGSLLGVVIDSNVFIYHRSGSTPTLFRQFTGTVEALYEITNGLIFTVSSPDPDSGDLVYSTYIVELKDDGPRVTYKYASTTPLYYGPSSDKTHFIGQFGVGAFTSPKAVFPGGAPMQPVAESAEVKLRGITDELALEPARLGFRRPANASDPEPTSYDVFALS